MTLSGIRRVLFAAASLLPFSFKKELGLENLDALKGMKHKQIGIARDDVRRVTAYR